MNPEFFKGMDGLTPVYDRMSKAIAETREKFPSGWSLAAEALAMAELLVPFTAANVGSAENDYRRNLLALWNPWSLNLRDSLGARRERRSGCRLWREPRAAHLVRRFHATARVCLRDLAARQQMGGY